MAGGFGRKRARGHQHVRVDANGLRRDVIGEAGLDDATLTALAHRIDEQAAQRRSWLPTLPPAKADLRRATDLANDARGAFTDLVVIASGDLALGIRGLVTALVPPTAGPEAPTSGTLRIHLLDEIDPDHLVALLARLDLRRTLFNVVSTTGEAIATMSHFLIIRDRLLRELGAVGYRQHVVVTTRARDGALRQIVNDEGFRDLALPDDVDEDAALLTPAALFPVACAGADPSDILAGAATMAERCRSLDDGASPLHLLASALHLAPLTGVEILPPPPSAFADVGRWMARRTVRVASGVDTATRATAPVALALVIERVRQDVEVPKAYQDLERVGYLGGQHLAALAASEREALEMACWRAGRPTITVTCPEVSAHVMGQLVALVEAAATAAHALGASDDADGPARRLAYGLVGRPGFEAERAEMQRLGARREDRYVA